MSETSLDDQARKCRAVMSDPDAPRRERARWTAWVEESPENRKAYLSVGRDGRQTGRSPRMTWGRALNIVLVGALAVVGARVVIALL